MRRGVRYIGVIVAVWAAVHLIGARHIARAEDVCPGDVNGDAQITLADVVAVPPVLFADADTDRAQAARSDANDDGLVSASDVTAILLLQGASCPDTPPTPSPTPTPTLDSPMPTSTAIGTATRSPTATPTGTAAGTPTRTPTSQPSPTATPACVVQPAPLGTTSHQITAADCRRSFGGDLRYTDVYSITGTPGTSIKIDVAATATTGSPLVPYVALVDADGQFDRLEGAPPIQFVITTSRSYQLFVTTRPSSPVAFGPYSLTLTLLPCPMPPAISLNSTRTATLTTTTCPDPGGPTVGSAINPTDRYTFAVSKVPANVSILMRQLNQNDNIDPTLTLIGPDGFAVGNDDDSGGGIAGLDAQMNFLALQAGTYTIIASGGGATGGYSLTVLAPTCGATALNDIPPDRPLICPAQPGPGCSGTLSSTLGGPPTTTCGAAPLGIPGASTTPPDVNSPADVYTFTAAAGEVISVGMSSDDEAHLYLLGPSSAGNPVLAEDDSSGPFDTSGDAQLAATLPVAGTYTIVAANNNVLQPGDPPVSYTLFVQKCPVRGLLNASTGRTSSGGLNAFDCLGFGDIPFRTYVFDGLAGQFVTTTVSSGDFDAFVRVFAPDGSRVENDDDLFDASTSDARVNRILPVDGRYIVEVSAAISQGAVDVTTTPPPAYSVRAQTCSTTTVPAGGISGSLDDGDCELVPGRKFDVYTFATGARPRAATILPPSNGCVVGLLAEGPQTPGDGCSTDLLEMPLLSTGRYGFIVAAATDATRGPYTVQASSCPLTVLGFGDTRTATLVGTDCADAGGAAADWYWFQAPADLVQFNSGLSGTVGANFPLAGVLTDAVGPDDVTGNFVDDADSMVPLGNSLGALLKVTGATPAANGSYTVSIDPASLR